MCVIFTWASGEHKWCWLVVIFWSETVCDSIYKTVVHAPIIALRLQLVIDCWDCAVCVMVVSGGVFLCSAENCGRYIHRCCLHSACGFAVRWLLFFFLITEKEEWCAACMLLVQW